MSSLAARPPPEKTVCPSVSECVHSSEIEAAVTCVEQGAFPPWDDFHERRRLSDGFSGVDGRVSIAATRDGAGHADHFWSLALIGVGR